MATRTRSNSRPPANRPIGFAEPATVANHVAGTTEPSDGATEQHRTAESVDRINGFAAISPFDAPELATGTEPEFTPGNAAEHVAGRRRGRPPGSTNRPRTTAPPSDLTASLSDIKSLLYSVHLMGAAILAVPELELTEDEAAKLADAMKSVARHYNVGIDPKKLALIQFGSTAVGIYGPKAIAVYRRASAAPKRAPVVPIRMPDTSGFPPAPQPDPRFTTPVSGQPEPRESMEPKPVSPIHVIVPDITNPSQAWPLPPQDSSGID